MENEPTDPVRLDLAGYETTGYEMTLGIKWLVTIIEKQEIKEVWFSVNVL